MKYFIKTFGCQMNVSDSERIAGFLEAQKLQPAKNLASADLVIFNTCGVRKMAEDRAYGQIHNLWKNNPRVKIVVTGCLADRKDIRKKLEKKVHLFFPISEFNKFENWIIENCLEIENWKLKIPAQKKTNICNDYLSLIPKHTNSYSAYVPVMTGCNNFCSYCVVPYARGRETSRPMEEILQEVESLIKSGVKEITLLGQNVNSYSPLYLGEMSRRTRRDRGVNFSDLLKKINALPGNFWIRFMSPHPKDMTLELIETITSLEKVCELVHLPIQSGDNTVLKNMNRAYSRAHYLELIKKIKRSFAKNKPGKIFALSSDIIVGFPGETEAQLEKTADVMKKVQFDMVYFGQFSSRPGTAAFQMKDDVTKSEKVRRERYLNEILAASALKNNKKYLQKVFSVLITSEKNGSYFGFTRTLKNVKIKSKEKNLIGKFINVKITKVTAWHLEGKL